MVDEGGSKSPANTEEQNTEPTLADDLRETFSKLSGEGEEEESPGTEADKDETEKEEQDSGEEGGQEEDGGSVEEDAGPSAPEHWKEEDKERFQALSVEGREFFMERYREIEGDHTRKSMQLASLNRILGPLSEEAKSIGVAVEDRLRGLVETHNKIKENPLSTILEIAERNGVSREAILEELGASESDNEEEEEEYESRTIKELRKVIDRLEKKIEHIGGNEKNKGEDEKSRQIEEANKIIREFRDAKDDKGNLIHLHFDDVWPDIQILARGYAAEGKKITLSELYDKAVAMNPSIAAKSNTKAAKDGNADSRKDKERKLKNARRASSGAHGRKEIVQESESVEGASLSDDLREVWKELSSR